MPLLHQRHFREEAYILNQVDIIRTYRRSSCRPLSGLPASQCMGTASGHAQSRLVMVPDAGHSMGESASQGVVAATDALELGEAAKGAQNGAL